MPNIRRTVEWTKMRLQGNWGSEQRRERRVRARRHNGAAAAALGRAIEGVAAVEPRQHGPPEKVARHSVSMRKQATPYRPRARDTTEPPKPRDLGLKGIVAQSQLSFFNVCESPGRVQPR